MTPQPFTEDDEFGMKAGTGKKALQDYTEK